MADKYAIFDRYAQSLKRLHPEYDGRYGCPLSMSLFRREAVATGELTEEHCIPNGLGKKASVLTAKRSNNEAGTDIDAHLHRMIAHDEVIRDGIGTIQGRLKFGTHQAAAEYSRVQSGEGLGSHFRISGDPRQSNPQQVAAMQEFSKRGLSGKIGKAGMSFRMHPHSFGDRQRARVGLLKAGYLMLFRQFGYAYILDDLLNAIRRQIAEPTQAVLPLNIIVFEMAAADYRDQTLLITEPEDRTAYLVPLMLRKNDRATPRYFGVILPATPRTFDAWTDAKAQELNVTPVSDEIDYIENPQPVIFY